MTALKTSMVHSCTCIVSIFLTWRAKRKLSIYWKTSIKKLRVCKTKPVTRYCCVHKNTFYQDATKLFRLLLQTKTLTMQNPYLKPQQNEPLEHKCKILLLYDFLKKICMLSLAHSSNKNEWNYFPLKVSKTAN